MPKNKPPVIVLVRPQLGENIGAVARAMMNFGLTELRLVAPRDGWPSARAREVASGGETIIDSAKLYPDTPSALEGIELAFATTARGRDLAKRVVTPQGAISETGKLQTALVFGPERTGLENEDIALCDAFLTIPTAPEHASLNIAQSVVVLAYEWFKTRHKPGKTDEEAPAPKEDWAGLFSQLEQYLDEVNFFRVPEKKEVMWNNTRNMLLRGRFSSQEVRTLRGILRVLWEGRLARNKK